MTIRLQGQVFLAEAFAVITELVIPTGADPDFLLRAASDDNVCGSLQGEPHADHQSHGSRQEIRGSVVEGPAVSSSSDDLNPANPIGPCASGEELSARAAAERFPARTISTNNSSSATSSAMVAALSNLLILAIQAGRFEAQNLKVRPAFAAMGGRLFKTWSKKPPG